MTIQTKLLSNFFIVAGIVLACSVFGIWSINKIEANLEYVTARAWSAANAAMETSIDNLTRIIAAEEYLRGDREQARFLIRRAEERFTTKFEQLRKSQLADETVLNNIKELWNKLVKLESKTLANYHLKNRTKLQLDENSLIWSKTLERLRYRLSLSRSSNAQLAQQGENTLVSIGLVSMAEKAAINNYLAGSIREDEIEDVIEGFRSNIKRKITELSQNAVVPPDDGKTVQNIYTESTRLTDKLISSHRTYRLEQTELSYNTLRLVEAFESIKEQMNDNMEQATRSGKILARKSQNYFALLAAAAFLFALVIGILITRLITHPIRILTRATQAIAKGDLTHRVNIDTNDELGWLSRSFNNMADDIHRYTEEIQKKSLQAELANQELLVTNKELYEALSELEKQSNILKETNKELEKATRLKSEFLANMSHELRTPMNSIIGFTKLVLRKSTDTIDTKQKENLQKVLLSAEQLLSLINSILDLSKIESGRMEVYIEPFVINDVAEQVKEVLWPLIMEKDLKFTIAIDPTLPRIYSDPEKVKQILTNLISNAVKFTQKGEITLSVRRTLATLRSHPSTDCVEITVRDTGIGIPSHTQPIIFEDFRQADGSTTRKYGGTGLGLSICKKLCALLGGALTLVESHVGKGSTFRVLLPIDYEIEKKLTDSTHGNAAAKITRLLTIDLSEEARAYLKNKILGEGVQILCANTGPAGYKTILKEMPDLILIQPAIQNKGWEFIAQIKNDPISAKIPVVAAFFRDNKTLCLPLPFDDFLAKPLDQTILLKTVSRRLGPDAKNILIVDNDPLVQETGSQFLSQKYFCVRCVNSLEETQILSKEQAFDMVLLDILLSAQNHHRLVDHLPQQKRPLCLALISTRLTLAQQEILDQGLRAAAQKEETSIETLIHKIGRILSPAATKLATLY